MLHQAWNGTCAAVLTRNPREDALDKPRLYVCFGVPKSGSTLAFKLSQGIALRAGFDQSPLLPDRGGNAYGNQSEDGFAALLQAAEALDRRMVVVKTHAEATSSVFRAVEDGKAIVQAHTRDPRDIALSMLDAAGRQDAWGKDHQGQPLQRIDDTRIRLRRLIARHSFWAGLPGALCLDYEHTAFATPQTAKRIAEHMGLKCAPLRDALRVKRQFTQFNTGQTQRHLREMEPDQLVEWYDAFREHIDQYCPPVGHRTWPAQIVTRLAQGIFRSR